MRARETKWDDFFERHSKEVHLSELKSPLRSVVFFFRELVSFDKIVLVLFEVESAEFRTLYTFSHPMT